MSRFTDLIFRLGAALDSNKPLVSPDGDDPLVNELLQCALKFPQTPLWFKFNTFASKESYDTVVLVSGGMDSTIMWERTKDSPNRLPLFVNLGHPYAQREHQAIIESGIAFPTVVNHPWHVYNSEKWQHIIPGRNLLLIAIASEFLKPEGGEIWLGAVEGETSPTEGDKSPRFFHLCEELLGRWTGKKVSIRTMQDRTKSDWLEWYLQQPGADKEGILKTITCFNASDKTSACGKCQACARKWLALRHCGIDTSKVFEVDVPSNMHGARHLVHYKYVLKQCLAENEFSHYTERRCQQDLAVIAEYELNVFKLRPA